MKLNLSKLNKGFTLIELLVVIAIIGLLASIVMASLESAKSKSRDARRIDDMKQIKIALEYFYQQTGKYPMVAGATTWSGYWSNFSTCLKEGTGCGFLINNYEPVLTEVPQDPLRTSTNSTEDDYTYYYGYAPSSCSDGQSYRIAAYLENSNNPVLDADVDGSFSVGNNGCDDGESSSQQSYCIGEGSCTYENL